MTVIRINVISVDPTSGDELAHRFAARAGAVDGADGFEGFELLKPTDERTQWLVITRWRDEESFAAWTSSPAFAHGHRSQQERDGGEAPGRSGCTARCGATRRLSPTERSARSRRGRRRRRVEVISRSPERVLTSTRDDVRPRPASARPDAAPDG